MVQELAIRPRRPPFISRTATARPDSSGRRAELVSESERSPSPQWLMPMLVVDSGGIDPEPPRAPARPRQGLRRGMPRDRKLTTCPSTGAREPLLSVRPSWMCRRSTRRPRRSWSVDPHFSATAQWGRNMNYAAPQMQRPSAHWRRRRSTSPRSSRGNTPRSGRCKKERWSTHDWATPASGSPASASDA